MATIALMGAGGKMGCRITDNLKVSESHITRYVEVSEAGLERLATRGLAATPVADAVPDADVVVLAVPDVVIGKVSAQVVPLMKPGAMVVLLDPAAAYLEEIVRRPDLAYFVSHPCHPPIFNNWEETREARNDHFGGIAAQQAIVNALLQGPDEMYALGDAVAREMYAPVIRSHRITVEQMALLEPAMAETMGATLVTIMHESMEEVIKRGVPAEAARDFMLGHAQIEMAIVFGFLGSPFSDAAKVAIEWAKERILRPDWKQVFEPEQVRDCIDAMLHPTKLQG
jgi:D-apionate oxidoisomerase